MNEPVHLQCLPEGLRPVGRDDVAGGGDLQQFAPPDRIGGGGRHLAGQLGIAPTVGHDGVAADIHGFELNFLFISLRVGQKIQRGDGGANVRLKLQESLSIDFAVQHGMARAALLHEFRKQAVFIALYPFRRHVAENQFAQGPAAPVGFDPVGVGLPDRVGHFERNVLAAVHHVKIRQRMAAEFRERGRVLRPLALFADDQLAVADPQGFRFQDMTKRQRPQKGNFHPAGVFFVGLGDGDRPFDGEVGDGGVAFPAQFLDSFVHAAFFHISGLLS